MKEKRRAVITGTGAICSLGRNVEEIWASIVAKRVGYALTELTDKRVNAKFFGLIDERVAAAECRGFPRGLIRMLSGFGRYAAIASREALKQAFGDDGPLRHYEAPECGVIVGTGWGGLDSANTNNNEYVRSGFSSPFSTIMSMNNLATATLTVLYKLRGYQNTPVAACASGAIAIGEAARVICDGHADFMLAGGSESLREIFNVWSIDVLEALTKEQKDVTKACCPFSLDRSGFVLSEGAALVCVEELEAARRRGARILGEVTAYRNYSDAHDFTAPAPDSIGRTSVIARSLEDARCKPEQIDYINAHGTSTPLNDYYESEAIKSTFGEASRRVPISSTKSYTGHLIGAAGALETVFCLKAMETGLVPATINLARPDPKCDLDYVPNEHRTNQKVDRCLNLSFGFGGANAALVLERAG